jgi:hypothetical protein
VYLVDFQSVHNVMKSINFLETHKDADTARSPIDNGHKVYEHKYEYLLDDHYDDILTGLVSKIKKTISDSSLGRDVAIYLNLKDISYLELSHNGQGSYAVLHDVAKYIKFSRFVINCFLMDANIMWAGYTPLVYDDGLKSLFSSD